MDTLIAIPIPDIVWVQVWVLDALPGEARAGAEGHKDHPADLIARLRALPLPIDSRTSLQRYLLEHGFSMDVAQWVCTNLQPVDRDNRCAPHAFICVRKFFKYVMSLLSM